MSTWSGWLHRRPSSDSLNASELGDPQLEERGLLDIPHDSDYEEDPSPFAFTKTEVGKRLYDPKDLNFFRAMGGSQGLALGLQVDPNTGLSPDENILHSQVTPENVWRIWNGSRRSVVRRDIINGQVENNFIGPINAATGPRPVERQVGTSSQATSKQSAIRFQDRRRVYGENKVPLRRPKNIFQFMWIALHDQVLVWPRASASY